MKKIKILLLLLLLVNGGVFAQSKECYYVDPGVLEGDASIVAENVGDIETYYFATTELTSGFIMQRGIFVYKIDDASQIIWKTKINDAITDIDYRSFSINLTENGVFVLASKFDSRFFNNKILLIHIDKASGAVLNTHEYSFLSSEIVYGLNLQKLNDESRDFIITGLMSSGIADDHKNISKTGLVMRVHEGGNVIWANSYNSPPHLYNNYSGNFYDYDRLNYTVENNDNETIYSVGFSTKVGSYQVPPNPKNYGTFQRTNVIMKLDKATGNIVWDNHNDFTNSMNLSMSKVLISGDTVVTLENYGENTNLVFRDHGGSLINVISFFGLDLMYIVGYNLLQDNSYYYITGYRNESLELVVMRVHKITHATEASFFVGFNSNFSNQDVNDYFSNFDSQNQSCYYQVHSVLINDRISAVSGVTTDGVKYTKIDNYLPFICTNENKYSTIGYSVLDEYPSFIKTEEEVWVNEYTVEYDSYPVDEYICYPGRPSNYENPINQISEESKVIAIQPNPVIDDFSLDINENEYFEIFNSLGQLITKEKYEYKKEGVKSRFNVSNLSPGLYYVRTTSNHYVFIKK